MEDSVVSTSGVTVQHTSIDRAIVITFQVGVWVRSHERTEGVAPLRVLREVAVSVDAASLLAIRVGEELERAREGSKGRREGGSRKSEDFDKHL